MYEFSNKVDFYVTNVCNYTCEDCNRFNNHSFTGWQRWSDYADTYAEWAKRVKIKAAVIMGGEPTLNPTLSEWVNGLYTTFRADVQILSNGSHLLESRGLYSALSQTDPTIFGTKHIGISLHNLDDFETIRSNIVKFLSGKITEWGRLINVPVPDYWAAQGPYWDHAYVAVDSNGVLIQIFISNEFGKSAITLSTDGKFSVFNNNSVEADQAFNNCAFAQYKSYHFIHGKLYRCAPVGLLPEFDQQHNLNLTDEDRALLNSYQPLTIENFDSYSDQFLKTIDNQIPQCKFCSPYTGHTKIFPIRKGSIKL